MTTVVRCPTCTRAVPWGPQSPWRPFCSERCRLIDLGEWFGEQHRMPADPDIDELLPPFGEDDEPRGA